MSGVLAAVLSTALGGTAIVSTRFLAGAADPITIGVLRFGGGAVLLLPLAGRPAPAGRHRTCIGSRGRGGLRARTRSLEQSRPSSAAPLAGLVPMPRSGWPDVRRGCRHTQPSSDRRPRTPRPVPHR